MWSRDRSRDAAKAVGGWIAVASNTATYSIGMLHLHIDSQNHMFAIRVPVISAHGRLGEPYTRVRWLLNAIPMEVVLLMFQTHQMRVAGLGTRSSGLGVESTFLPRDMILSQAIDYAIIYVANKHDFDFFLLADLSNSKQAFLKKDSDT